jgi:hypothetical protein
MCVYVMYVLSDIVTPVLPVSGEGDMYFGNSTLAFKQLCAEGHGFRSLGVFVL